MTATVDDPLGRPIEAIWGALGDGRTAVIEMARSSGIALLSPEERDPLVTTTYGVGQLMKLALDDGYRNLIHRHRRQCHERRRCGNGSGVRCEFTGCGR